MIKARQPFHGDGKANKNIVHKNLILLRCVSLRKIIKNQFSAFIFISKASSKCFPTHFKPLCSLQGPRFDWEALLSLRSQPRSHSLQATCDSFPWNKILFQYQISFLFTFCFNCFFDTRCFEQLKLSVYCHKKKTFRLRFISLHCISLSLSLTLNVKMPWFDSILIWYSRVVIIVFRLAT